MALSQQAVNGHAGQTGWQACSVQHHILLDAMRSQSCWCCLVQSLQYVWLEGWSEDYQRPFFYNQESKQSSWDRPPDLAWHRIAIETQQS